jgi:Flp pilus assembly protein TadB
MIRVKWSALKQNRWYEYLVRFALGGGATVVTGIIAKAYGPVTGGLFLAFPAIFCASATLVESHERRRKKQKSLRGARRGQEAAALDAAGAALGSFALAGFGAMVWWGGQALGWPVLALALAAWAVIAVFLWWIWFRQRAKPRL